MNDDFFYGEHEFVDAFVSPNKPGAPATEIGGWVPPSAITAPYALAEARGGLLTAWDAWAVVLTARVAATSSPRGFKC